MLRIAALALVVAAVLAPTATAGVDCNTNSAAEVAAATVVDRGNAWSQPGQPDLWEVTMSDLNTSVDVYAADDAAARAAAKSWLDGQVSSACAASAPAAPAAPTGGTTTTPTGGSATGGTTTTTTTVAAPSSQAQQLANTADVTYVGNSWGPTPIWRVTVPSLNMTIDVAANSADEARTNALPTIQSALGEPVTTTTTTTVGPSGAATTTTTAPVLPTSPATVAPPVTDPTQSLISAAVLNPDRSLGYLVRAGYGTDGALSP